MDLELDSKLPDESLRAFMRETESSRRSVILELDTSPPRLGGARSSSGAFRPVFIDDPSAEELAAQQERVSATAVKLQELLGVEPRYLSAAKAFVLLVTPSQLQTVLRLPGVRSVRDNRTLKR